MKKIILIIIVVSISILTFAFSKPYINEEYKYSVNVPNDANINDKEPSAVAFYWDNSVFGGVEAFENVYNIEKKIEILQERFKKDIPTYKTKPHKIIEIDNRNAYQWSFEFSLEANTYFGISNVFGYNDNVVFHSFLYLQKNGDINKIEKQVNDWMSSFKRFR